MKNKGEGLHPRLPDLVDQMEKGTMTRREFLRYATLLGVSAAAASSMVGLPMPGQARASGIRRGGTMKIASSVQKVTHPAQFSWVEPSNMFRQVGEYLTQTDNQNITRPFLLEGWKASEDIKTWTLNLRKGITFNNGDEFNADDVVFTMNQWLNEDVGSSIKGMMGAYLSPSGIEKVNDHQVKLHLSVPEIAVPEHLFHYPALILNHRTFEGDFVKAPHGTGPFTLEVYREGERCVLKARKDYWQKGADGKPLPYMDGIEFVDMGDEMSPKIAAIKSGEIDSIDLATTGGTSAYQALKDDAGINVMPIGTAQVRLLRMRVDLDPWKDNRVRMALKLCQHREKILGLAYFGQGVLGHDFHVSPVHPEFCEKPVPKYDPDKARQLLKEAGFPNGLDVNCAVGSEWTDVVRYIEVLKQDAAPAGLRINIQTMPTSQYWEKWTEVDLGVTPWTHRPLGTMVLNLAYVTDDAGKPVAWNETNWSDPEFSKLLKEANGTLDLEARRKIMCKLEQIQWERGSIGAPFWQYNWQVTTKRVRDSEPHPTGYYFLNKAWLAG